MNLMNEAIKKNVAMKTADANTKKVQAFSKKSVWFIDPVFIDDEKPQYYAVKNKQSDVNLKLSDIKLLAKLTFVKSVKITPHYLYLFV